MELNSDYADNYDLAEELNKQLDHAPTDIIVKDAKKRSEAQAKR